MKIYFLLLIEVIFSFISKTNNEDLINQVYISNEDQTNYNLNQIYITN